MVIIEELCDDKFLSGATGFDYRPYVLCCCPALQVLDGFLVQEAERQQAVWLYHQGYIQHMLPGQHVLMVTYLATVCPLVSAQQSLGERTTKGLTTRPPGLSPGIISGLISSTTEQFACRPISFAAARAQDLSISGVLRGDGVCECVCV
ncbi:hypothetical protein ACOMHN_031980 [Nucella lapillus]